MEKNVLTIKGSYGLEVRKCRDNVGITCSYTYLDLVKEIKTNSKNFLKSKIVAAMQ